MKLSDVFMADYWNTQRPRMIALYAYFTPSCALCGIEGEQGWPLVRKQLGAATNNSVELTTVDVATLSGDELRKRAITEVPTYHLIEQIGAASSYHGPGTSVRSFKATVQDPSLLKYLGHTTTLQ